MKEYTKPFYRILKPIKSDYRFGGLFDSDPDFANDKNSLSLAYKLIEKDFMKVLEFIQPHEDNLKTYSHRIYELYLRTCTEFETNCKCILEANGYKMSKNLNITDYFELNQILQLDLYKVDLKFWPNSLKSIYPFKEWAVSHELSWYRSYNKVKHNRNENFSEANLDNLIFALSGLVSILFAQFGHEATNPFDYDLPRRSNLYTHIHKLEDSIFNIYPFEAKTKDEVHVYDIDLVNWKDKHPKFNKFFEI